MVCSGAADSFGTPPVPRVGGLNVGFTENLTALVIFDGVHVHPLLNFS
jgi:hypothetical protein